MYSTCCPFASETTLKLPGRVVALVGEPVPGKMSGGQMPAHVDVQAEVVAVSGVK